MWRAAQPLGGRTRAVVPRSVHRIALFAARDILPYEELTYDYGYVVGSVEGKTLRCLCGAPSCRGYLF